MVKRINSSACPGLCLVCRSGRVHHGLLLYQLGTVQKRSGQVHAQGHRPQPVYPHHLCVWKTRWEQDNELWMEWQWWLHQSVSVSLHTLLSYFSLKCRFYDRQEITLRVLALNLDTFISRCPLSCQTYYRSNG